MFLASPVAPASFGAWRNLELQPVAANHRGVLKLLESPDAKSLNWVASTSVMALAVTRPSSGIGCSAIIADRFSESLENGLRHAGKRYHLLRGVKLDRGLRHSENHGTFLILSEGA